MHILPILRPARATLVPPTPGRAVIGNPVLAIPIALLAALLIACGGDGATAPPTAVDAVQVSLASSTLLEGTGTQATATLTDAEGNTLSGRVIVWESSNTAVATVSATGLVNAVARGTATVTATSESRSGGAAVTVTPAVALEGLTLLDAAGTALDITNVAGTVEVGVDPVVPADFRGVLEVHIGGVLMAMDSVVGGGLAALSVPRRLKVETAQAVTTIANDVLRSTPLMLNGEHSMTVTLSGTYGASGIVDERKTAQITLRNADAIRLWTKPETLILLNGKLVSSGSVSGYIEDLSYSGVTVSRVEIVAAGAQSLYGPNVGNVVNIITQTSPDIGRMFTIPRSGLAYESPDVGTRYVGRTIVRGDQTYRTGDIISNNGNASSTDGSLLYTSPDTVSALAGYRLQQIPLPTSGALPPGLVVAGGGAFYHDGLGPRPLSGAFLPPSRDTSVGQPAVSSGWLLGLSDNYLGASTDLNTFVDVDQFEDILAGFDPDVPFTYYASTQRVTLFSDNNIINDVTDIPASTNRNVFIGVRVTDRAGNPGFAVAGVTSANPFGVGGEATFGRLTSIGALSVSGLLNGGIVGGYNWQVSALAFEASGSRFPANAIYGSIHKYGDPASCYYGTGANCERPEVLGGTLGAGGSVVNLTISVADMLARRAQREGGTGNGLYSGTYSAADLGGNVTTGPYQPPRRFNLLLDTTSPGVTVTTTYPTATTVAVTMHASDDIGVAKGEVGLFFDHFNTAFAGNHLFAPIYHFPMGTTLDDGSLSTTASISWTDTLITTGRFFDPESGVLEAQGFRVTGAYFGVHDFARNLTYASEATAYTGAVEAMPSGITGIKFSLSTQEVCGGETCVGDIPRSVVAHVDVQSPGDASPLAKATFMGLYPDGVPRYFGHTVTPTRTSVAGGFNHRYEIAYTPSDDCIPLGPVLGEVMLITADGRQALFPGRVPLINMQQPTVLPTNCDAPTRPLGESWTGDASIRRR